MDDSMACSSGSNKDIDDWLKELESWKAVLECIDSTIKKLYERTEHFLGQKNALLASNGGLQIQRKKLLENRQSYDAQLKSIQKERRLYVRQLKAIADLSTRGGSQKKATARKAKKAPKGPTGKGSVPRTPTTTAQFQAQLDIWCGNMTAMVNSVIEDNSGGPKVILGTFEPQSSELIELIECWNAAIKFTTDTMALRGNVVPTTGDVLPTFASSSKILVD